MATKKDKTEKKTSVQEEENTTKLRYNTLVIQEQGAKYKTLFTEKYKNRTKWERPDLRKVVSDIPGTVISINVKEGQEVKEGDLMMVLEAMKMKNKIYFHMDGVVKKIYITEEEKIPKNHLMIELE